MFSDIHAAESLVALLVIFSECPIDRDWSVAHVSVEPAGSFPFVQYDGNVPSKLPMFERLDVCARAPMLAVKIASAIQRNRKRLFIADLLM
jgi:hypothetical protein